MRTKQLITEIPEAHGNTYQLWAEIIPCDNPAQTTCLRFLTAWSGARDAQAMQVKGEYFLDRQALDRLTNILHKAQAQ